MALSNSQYQEIMRDYQAQQLKNKHEQDARVSEIYEILPAVKELDQAVSSRAVQRAKELLNGDQKALERLREEIRDLPFIREIDVLVDGRFVEELKDTSLHWVGSSNQRIIDVKKTCEQGEIVLYESNTGGASLDGEQ